MRDSLHFGCGPGSSPRPRGIAVGRFALLGFFAFGFFLFTAACDDDDAEPRDDLGRPCYYDGDCAGELICDFHEGLGICQAPHTHGETDTDTDTGSAPEGSA